MRIARAVLVVMALVLISVNSVGAQEPTSIKASLAEFDASTELIDVEWSPDGESLAASSFDGVFILDASLQLQAHIYPNQQIRGISWNPAGNRLALTHGANLEIWGWDAMARTLVLEHSLPGNNLQAGVLWSPNGLWIVTQEIMEQALDELGVLHGAFHFWNTAPFESRFLSDGLYDFSAGTIHQASWSPDGQPVLAGVGGYGQLENGIPIAESGRVIYMIDAETGLRLQEFPTVGSISWAIAWRPPLGDLVADVSEGGMGLYEVTSGAFVADIFVLNVHSLDWSPDGRYLAGDNVIFDVSAGNAYLGSFDLAGGVLDVDWHPSGTRLAVARWDGNLSVQDTTRLPGFELPVLPAITPKPTPAPTPG